MEWLKEILGEGLTLVLYGFFGGFCIGLIPFEAMTRIAPVGPHITLKQQFIRTMLWGALAAIVSLTGGVVVLLYPYGRELFVKILAAIGLRLTQLFVGLGVMVIGVGAYIFKVKRQSAYGVVEIMFAGVASVIAAKQLTTTAAPAAALATLAGSVYVVSRGMSNYFEGKKFQKVKVDPNAIFPTPSTTP